ncbi:hypothetical protein HG535_0D03680 [Zygotorulaspora mrakii]|uniref:t-SNARE coiled-coil homology domain-containing protein n=1 Tax=Zygotorulaspora mrakii TaxID=42260 RepID=A0A7H9B214_ZYGMR|nr:uncharacterized protein HG535_0D03680 [Zygotorulaspora mrakii]QLG72660.1 hypothetical protein HG535_0D03680 [Zygotorulaspora mrakii]
MSNSRYSQLENRNDQNLDNLASKLATFRSINQDIGDQAVNDSSVANQVSNAFDSMLNNVKNSSQRLTRSMNIGNNVWKMVGLTLLLFFILYTLFKLF